MPLLLIPALLLSLLAMLLLLWPLGLWQRYRVGRARRRARPGWVALNAAGLLLSSLLLLAAAVVAAIWIEDAAWNAGAGLLAGTGAGPPGLWVARFAAGDGQLYFAANAWLLLAPTLLVAARVALAGGPAWRRAWEGVPAPGPWPWLAQPASLWALGAL